MAKRDIKQEVTDTIVAALEAGVAPWVKSWTGGQSAWPRNGSTGKSYNGVNVLLLEISAMQGGYASNEWMTYKQAAGMGGQVTKGSKGTTIIFWKIFKTEDKKTGEEKTVPMLRHYTVFNREQIEGLPEPVVAEPVSEAIRHERAEALINATGAKVAYGMARAYYAPATDSIGMPSIEQFDTESEYYSTHLHELAHWTGHASRLDRSGGSYGHEELIAELGSAFVCAEIGVDGKLQHAEYIGAWIKNLKADKNAIFGAASRAKKAANFLLGFEAGQEEEELTA
jgi:antirestriction protein ArdC